MSQTVSAKKMEKEFKRRKIRKAINATKMLNLIDARIIRKYVKKGFSLEFAKRMIWFEKNDNPI